MIIKLLYEADLVSAYEGFYGDDKLVDFAVGDLTPSGCDFLDKIRENGAWAKLKKYLKEKGPDIALDGLNAIVSAVLSGVIKIS